jgi:hypothetical protein
MIQIQVLSTSIETVPTQKGSYQSLEIAYKDLSNSGKVSAKKLMSFTNKPVFETMALAKPTEVYDVEMVKNDKGYWDWTKVTKGTGTSVSGVTAARGQSAAVGATAPSKGGWETPEERAKKQIYIVRQSSLSTAASVLTANTKVTPTAKDVIAFARELEAYVFEVDQVPGEVKKDVGTIETMDEDIPL